MYLTFKPPIPDWCPLTYFFTCSVISGVGELDLDKGLMKKAEPNTKDKPYPDCPFLLLDVRDRDSYQQCHIVGGKRRKALQQLTPKSRAPS